MYVIESEVLLEYSIHYDNGGEMFTFFTPGLSNSLKGSQYVDYLLLSPKFGFVW